MTPESTELAFGSITGTNAGTANTVYTLRNDSRMLSFENTTDVELVMLIGALQKRVPAGAFRVFDFPRLAKNTVVKVFRAAGAPTVGVIEVYSTPMR